MAEILFPRPPHEELHEGQLTFIPSTALMIGWHPAVQAAHSAMKDAFGNHSLANVTPPPITGLDPATPDPLRKLIKQTEDNELMTCAALTALFRDSDSTDVVKFSRSHLEEYLHPDVLQQTGLHRVMGDNITSCLQRIQAMEDAAEALSTSCKSAIDNDLVLGLGILDVLANPAAIHRAGEDNAPEAVALLATFEHENPSRTKPSLIDHLMTSLDRGDFDTMLASKVVSEIKANPDRPGNQDRLLSWQRMISLLVATGKSEDAARSMLVSSAGVQEWPTRLATALASEREDKKQKIEEKMAQRRKNLVQAVLLLPAEPDKLYAAHMSALVRAAQNQLPHVKLGANGNGRISRAGMMALRAQDRRNQRGFQGNAKPGNNTGAEKAAVLREIPRSFAFINPRGEYYNPSNGDEAECVKDYVTKHGGGSKELVTSIHDFFETLRLLDLSKGIVRGSVPHHKNFTVNGVNVGTLWQIRPDKIPVNNGLGKYARKLRIFCVLEDGRVGVYKLLDKDEVRPFQRSHGLIAPNQGSK